MASGEMLIELGDSWFIAKAILVAILRDHKIQYSTGHRWCLTSERKVRGLRCRNRGGSPTLQYPTAGWGHRGPSCSPLLCTGASQCAVVCQSGVAKDLGQERNNSIHRLKFLSGGSVNLRRSAKATRGRDTKNFTMYAW